MKRVLLGLLLLTALATWATPAAAVNLPRSQARPTSAAIVNGTLVWFQRNDRVRHMRHGGRAISPGVGAVYARALSSKHTARIYVPPKGSRIVGFNAGAGRVVVGLATVAEGDRGPSSLTELIPNAGEWTANTLISEDDPAAAGSCGARVTLVGIDSHGTILGQRTRMDARGEGCVLVRQESKLIGLPIGGSETVLGLRKSGWSGAIRWNLLPDLWPLGDGATLQLSTDMVEDRSAISTWVPSSDHFAAITSEVPIVERIERLGDSVLLRFGWVEAGVLAQAGDHASYQSVLDYENGRNWYRACGDRLLVINRSWRAAKRRAKWRLTLRSSDGEVQRTLGQKVPNGALLDACDQNVAVFHRPRHDGGIKQWAVKLGD